MTVPQTKNDSKNICMSHIFKSYLPQFQHSSFLLDMLLKLTNKTVYIKDTFSNQRVELLNEFD